MHTKTSPPPGVHIRTATMADLPDVFAVATEAETAGFGAPDTVLADLQEGRDGLDPAADAVLAQGESGNVLCVAIIRGDERTSVDIGGYKGLRARADPTE